MFLTACYYIINSFIPAFGTVRINSVVDNTCCFGIAFSVFFLFGYIIIYAFSVKEDKTLNKNSFVHIIHLFGNITLMFLVILIYIMDDNLMRRIGTVLNHCFIYDVARKFHNCG